MLARLLPVIFALPLIGFIECLLLPRKQETSIFSVAMVAMSSALVTYCLLLFHWIANDFTPLTADAGSIYAGEHFRFDLEFYFDRVTAVFMGMATVMTTLVLIFSKPYMHREPGYKRFYSTVLLFFIGLSVIILAGNFEVLFVGWELIGISSVLLIAFYRDRFLPTRNALKVFSVYRLADVFILLSIWYAHHVFEKNVNFSELAAVASQHAEGLTVLGIFLLVAAAIKSAQFPFSYWLPRAMEGPTTSSAIFYGALSVHMGLFLMLRTYPIWEDNLPLRIGIGALGLVTALVASSIAHVQSSIKTQIGYASITQIGIMFIELALGLHWLVLLHFVSNAALRTYQLLISPSVVSYLVHDQFFYFVAPVHKIKNTLMGKIRATIYVLSVKEWDMNSVSSHYIWSPIKAVGRMVAGLDNQGSRAGALVLFAALVATVSAIELTESGKHIISILAAVIGILFYIRTFSTKGAALICWDLIMLGHLFSGLFLSVASNGGVKLQLLYGVGILVAYIVGAVCLWHIERKGEPTALRDYNGSIYLYPLVGQLFFVVALLFMSFPISPSFLAQDILLSEIPEDRTFLVIFFCISYLLSGVSIMRLYIKSFFGPHNSSHHENAYKAS